MERSEFDKIREQSWPLLEVDEEKSHDNIVAIRLGHHAFQGVNIEGKLDDFILARLDMLQAKAEMFLNFVKKYPNLHPGIDDDLSIMTIYVARPGHKEIAGYLPIDLEELNRQAGIALEPGNFMCRFCHRGLPITMFCTFYYAARICKDCAKNNPDFVAKAKRERY